MIPHEKNCANLILMVGNIGSGKSLMSLKYAKNGYVIINNDKITEMVNGEYASYNVSMKSIYRAIEIAGIEEALKCGKSIVIDRTNMAKKDRKPYIDIAQKYNIPVWVWDFGPGDKNNLERRKKDSKGVPYHIWETVFDRMYKSYEKPSAEEGIYLYFSPIKKFIVHAFDFDGTMVENNYPDIGKMLPLIEKIKELWKDFHNIIVIWTCRHGNDLLIMRDFLIKNEIPFDAINRNPLFETGSRKIYADIYYDDRSINPNHIKEEEAV